MQTNIYVHVHVACITHLYTNLLQVPVSHSKKVTELNMVLFEKGYELPKTLSHQEQLKVTTTRCRQLFVLPPWRCSIGIE